MKLIGGVFSTGGSYRENNEDAVCLRIEGKSERFAFGLVCDGIGGLEKGELASGFIRDAAEEWFSYISSWLDPSDFDSKILYSHLRDAAEDWNLRLCDDLRENVVRSGTTMSCILLVGGNRFIVHVGDSRIYRYSPTDGLAALTTDDASYKLDNGRMRSFLTSYMGKAPELWINSSTAHASEDELYIFCSDGFYHNLCESDAAQMYVSAVELSARGRADEGLTPLCGEWADEMAARGEHDNISVGLIYVCPEWQKGRLCFARSRSLK